MRSFFILLTVHLSILLTHAEGYVPLSLDTWKSDFSSFSGTYTSLPPGIAVSKDGQNIMPGDDADYRGTSEGGVTTGGCYAWKINSEEKALGCQPTTDKFTPGFFQVAVSNASGTSFEALIVEYEVVVMNNENRSSHLKLMIGNTNGVFENVESTEFVTPATADIAPQWTRTKIKCTVKLKQRLPPDGRFFLRWYTDDSGGSGYRDEYGLNYISIKGIPNLGFVMKVR